MIRARFMVVLVGKSEKLTGRDSSESPLAEYACLQFLAGFMGPLPEGVMYLLIAGIGLLIWNLNRIGLVADMSWWWVLSPFVMAVVWWTWADMSGYTKRKEMEKMDQKKQDRLDKQKAALGIRTRRR
jgi:small Trp-rich protein